MFRSLWFSFWFIIISNLLSINLNIGRVIFVDSFSQSVSRYGVLSSMNEKKIERKIFFFLIFDGKNYYYYFVSSSSSLMGDDDDDDP